MTDIKLLTEIEVAAMVRKSVSWLQRKRCTGGDDAIPYRKLGRSVRYDYADVLAWIERHILQK
jgi:predicted DNA-binding transcriptional regulator AlpA